MGFSAREALIEANSVPNNSELSGSNPSDRRKHPRDRVLKAAKVITPGGYSVFNCLVLDESRSGVFVDFGGMMTIPEEVTIQFASGAAFPAVPRWSAGGKCGFEFSGPQIISHEVANSMQAIAKILNDHGIQAAFDALRKSDFFDNRELRQIAESARFAHMKLEAALHGEQIT
jgi:hypothetical protein